MTLTLATNRQIPDHAIFDHYNKQTYLGNRYSYVIATNTPGATTEVDLLLLKNTAVTTRGFPSGNVSLFCDLRKATSLTASQSSIFKFYINPTITTAGTAKTPLNLRTGSPNTSIAALSTGPTIAAKGSLVDSINALTFVQAQSDLLVILDPGKTMLVTVQTSSDTTDIQFGLSWYEL